MNQDRILDVVINRASEGLRVLEDIARFNFDHRPLSAALRQARHSVRNLSRDRAERLLAARDSAADVGLATSMADGNDRRQGLKDTVLSNFKRVQEACRSLEEMLKTASEYQAGKAVETLRFTVYDLEKQMMALAAPVLPGGVYGILGEKFSRGLTNAQVAEQMVAGGIDVLQYREKLTDKSRKQIYRECLEVRKITADAGIPFIVNDFLDVALMVGADGVHQGQDDLPVKQVKQMAPHLMAGCSTHSPAQAAKAVEDGADYIGVGPIFTTQTKADVCEAVGFSYLEHVVQTHDIPFVAIGGIKRHNLPGVVSRGARTVCLVTEIIGAHDIKKRIQQIKQIIGENQ